MAGGLSVQIRRINELLHWIGSTGGDAVLVQGTIELGSWAQVVRGWQAGRSEVRLRLRSPGGERTVGLSGLRRDPWGMTFTLSATGGCRGEKICLVWGEEGAAALARHRETLGGVCAWARARWPGCRIVSIARRTDRVGSLSGRYLRIVASHRSGNHLLMSEPGDGTSDRCASMVTQAVLWTLDRQRRGRSTRSAHLFVPKGEGRILCHRTALINPDKLRLSVWEYAWQPGAQWSAVRSEPAPAAESRTCRWPVPEPCRSGPPLSRILDLAPQAIRRHPRFPDYESLRLYGLEFARACGENRDIIRFGVGFPDATLNESNFDELRRLVNEILYFRRPDTPDPRHPYYRLQTERWLECQILDQAGHLFPELRSELFYPQIPVYVGEVQGRLDILAVDREDRLVVMELKTATDLDLPFQSLDYWGRVILHNRMAEFDRRGYFPGIQLTRREPKLYLVAPLFSFHDSTEPVFRFLDPRLEVWKIGLNEGWRAAVKILRKTRLCVGD